MFRIASTTTQTRTLQLPHVSRNTNPRMLNFRKSTCFVRDLQGTIYYLKAVVTGLPNLTYVTDQLCSSCEMSKAKEVLQGQKYFLGTEFLNKTLHAYFKEEGIEHQTSTPRTPEQNGVVERRNRTLVEAARTMLSASKLPLSFWAEAFMMKIKEIMSDHNSSDLAPQRQEMSVEMTKASDYDNSDPVPPDKCCSFQQKRQIRRNNGLEIYLRMNFISSTGLKVWGSSRPTIWQDDFKAKLVMEEQERMKDRLCSLEGGSDFCRPTQHTSLFQSSSDDVKNALKSLLDAKKNRTALLMSSAEAEYGWVICKLCSSNVDEDTTSRLWLQLQQNTFNKVVRLGINPMIQPEPEDLPKDNPKLEIAVLRSDTLYYSHDGMEIFRCHHQTALAFQDMQKYEHVGQIQTKTARCKDDKDNDKAHSQIAKHEEQVTTNNEGQRPRTLELKRQKQSH
ncbi:integrase, catalytic region, zinc finger, CCHC-type containing protein [Tanacetum coccineum]